MTEKRPEIILKAGDVYHDVWPVARPWPAAVVPVWFSHFGFCSRDLQLP